MFRVTKAVKIVVAVYLYLDCWLQVAEFQDLLSDDEMMWQVWSRSLLSGSWALTWSRQLK